MDFTKFSVFRLPNKYKRFDYTPRYYDPEKEEREKRLKKIQADQAIFGESEGEKRIQFRSPNQASSIRKSQTMKSNMRLFLILGALIITLYYLYTNTADAESANQIINK